MPGQNKVIGFYNSVGTSFGFGDRPDPNTGDKMTNPGPGAYHKSHVDKQAEGENYCMHRKSMDDPKPETGPTWK